MVSPSAELCQSKDTIPHPFIVTSAITDYDVNSVFPGTTDQKLLPLPWMTYLRTWRSQVPELAYGKCVAVCVFNDGCCAFRQGKLFIFNLYFPQYKMFCSRLLGYNTRIHQLSKSCKQIAFRGRNATSVERSLFTPGCLVISFKSAQVFCTPVKKVSFFCK